MKFIADFLLSLDRELQPSTKDGYRSAIADKMGNSPITVSKDKNLTLLLDSCLRDKRKGHRGIPYWNFSLPSVVFGCNFLSWNRYRRSEFDGWCLEVHLITLALHQLNKASFEHFKESTLKHLTFKTAFLLALGSGKHRSERSMLGSTKTSGSRQSGPRYLATPHPAFFQRISWPKRV